MAKRKRLTAPEKRPETHADPRAAPDGAASPGAAPKARTPFGAGAPPIAQVTGDAAAQAALAEVAGALSAARAEGRLIQALPLEAIEAGHLVRDRMAAAAEDEEMAALIESLRARGQQTPIDVVALEGGRFGLISGWRRLTALRRLAGEGGSDTVLARVCAPATAPETYVAMVEENEIRASLSYYERARIVVRAVEAGVFADRPAALRTLFANVSRAKRSKIRAFTEIVDALDAHLTFPTQIGERLGLVLAQALAAKPDLQARLVVALNAAPEDAAAEQKRILEVLNWTPKKGAAPPRSVPDPPPAVDPAAGLRADLGAPPLAITLTEAPGRLTLEGPDVTPQLAARLARWLGLGPDNRRAAENPVDPKA